MISALVGHLMADFLLQTHWMATNKKHKTFPCVVHCFIWATTVMLFAKWPLWTFAPLFITHFIQDRTQIIEWWMDITGSNEFRTGIYAPWSVIVVDNCFHILTLWIIWRLI